MPGRSSASTLRVAAAVLFVASYPLASGSEVLTPEPGDDAYSFVTHYRITINAPPDRVWPCLLDLKAWMYDFSLEPESDTPTGPGHVLNLYEESDFKIQITAVEPNKLLAIANLPLTFKGESGTGVGIMTLHENRKGTEVSLTMSRRYTWQGSGANPLRAQRSSAAFQDQTAATWTRFLTRLKQNVERKIDLPTGLSSLAADEKKASTR